MENQVIVSNKEILGGTPVFNGTRVPVQFLFEYLEEGDSIQDFLKSYPTVSKEQVQEVLKLAEKILKIEKPVS